jgi:hypothetical protein
MNNIEVPHDLGFGTSVGTDGWYTVSYKQNILIQTSYPSLAEMVESLYVYNNLVYLNESN